ncbi:hypothetical protein L2E82_33781 [Cichorium intybus]|uniref:Uncharacterized protein n=1 Tax=Cichorium intybus TaxID=13427 RepID=A0ACB9BL21_CICIN|nr:hypothetical protein L2E82_33781 [Cichorium intybus]
MKSPYTNTATTLHFSFKSYSYFGRALAVTGAPLRLSSTVYRRRRCLRFLKENFTRIARLSSFHSLQQWRDLC